MTGQTGPVTTGFVNPGTRAICHVRRERRMLRREGDGMGIVGSISVVGSAGWTAVMRRMDDDVEVGEVTVSLVRSGA